MDDLLYDLFSFMGIGFENQILFLTAIINKLKRKNKVIHLRGAI